LTTSWLRLRSTFRVKNSKRGGAILARATSRSRGTIRTVGAAGEWFSDAVHQSSQRLATTLATPVTSGADLLVCQARVVGSLQRLGSRHRVGSAHAGRDDCDLHIHLRRNLWRTLWRKRFSLGLRTLSVLRSVALDHVSGGDPAVGQYDRGSLKPRQASRLPARGIARRASLRRTGNST